LQPRAYDLKVVIELRGRGPASQLVATTVAPLAQDGQQVDSLRIQTQGCQARIRNLPPLAGQLYLSAPAIASGQVIMAVTHYRLTLYKDYRGYQQEQFLTKQPQPPTSFRREYLVDSPGIQTRAGSVGSTVEKIVSLSDHPWEKAKAFHQWVRENIEGRRQDYTSVVESLKKRIGDCEERAATFVAFCRASGIPARLVWVPNHNWAEFHLVDEQGQGHWIPAHTAAYPWFGWTGVHELTLQKGDSIKVPEKRTSQRLLADWVQWKGARPDVRFLAELTPLATEASTIVEPGPGARRKDERGEWKLIGDHAMEAYGRDGRLSHKRGPEEKTRQQ
jgi:hypothetical protein